MITDELAEVRRSWTNEQLFEEYEKLQIEKSQFKDFHLFGMPNAKNCVFGNLYHRRREATKIVADERKITDLSYKLRGL